MLRVKDLLAQLPRLTDAHPSGSVVTFLLFFQI